MFKKGLIHRVDRLVNYDCVLKTSEPRNTAERKATTAEHSSYGII